MLPQYHFTTYPSPQFDVSFPEKLLKIVATTGEIFSAPPDPLAAIMGGYF